MLRVTSCPSKVCGILLVGFSSTTDGGAMVVSEASGFPVCVDGRVSIYYIWKHSVCKVCANRTAVAMMSDERKSYIVGPIFTRC